LTVEEARAAIRGAGGDVIQVGFLALAFERLREEDPGSEQTAAARKRLSELVAKRLKDCKQLSSEGSFVLLDEPGSPGHTPNR
jgi:threonine aldolase